MKKEEKQKAIKLREMGQSIGEIAQRLRVSKSSASFWVRHIELTSAQKSRLTKRGFSINAIEKRRIARISKTQRDHQAIKRAASKMIRAISYRDLWLLGIALYWGEGGKTNRGCARISNSDPAVIILMMRFFREICNVPEAKFRGHVHTFSHLNKKIAEEYWSGVSGIPSQSILQNVHKEKCGQQKSKGLPTLWNFSNICKRYTTLPYNNGLD